MSDWIKAPIILLGYLLGGPLLGMAIRGSRRMQEFIFFLMVFMTSWHINKFTLMLHSVETYRGHTKGFEFSLIEILAIGLITASILNRDSRDREWRWVPPGTFLYLLYVGVSALSM